VPISLCSALTFLGSRRLFECMLEPTRAGNAVPIATRDQSSRAITRKGEEGTRPCQQDGNPIQGHVRVPRGQTSAKIPRIGLLWHEASTEKAVIYLGADLSCRQNATHSRDIDRLLNHPLGRPCP
jgi:hypothetical protein